MKAKPGPSFKDWKTRWLLGLPVGAEFQTRRPVNPQPEAVCRTPWDLFQADTAGCLERGSTVIVGGVIHNIEMAPDGSWMLADKMPLPYQPGQRYYLREALRKFEGGIGDYPKVAYAANGDDPHLWWLPGNTPSVPKSWEWQRDKLSAIFMPRDAARLFATCIDVRVEGLGEISTEDAVAEGTGVHPGYIRARNIPVGTRATWVFRNIVLPEIYGEDLPKWWLAYTFKKEASDE